MENTNTLGKFDVDRLISLAQDFDFDGFCQKISQYVPTDSVQNREQAREIYDMIRDGADRDKVLTTLECALDERERKGIGKGVAIGAGITLLGALAAAFLWKKND